MIKCEVCGNNVETVTWNDYIKVKDSVKQVKETVHWVDRYDAYNLDPIIELELIRNNINNDDVYLYSISPEQFNNSDLKIHDEDIGATCNCCGSFC